MVDSRVRPSLRLPCSNRRAPNYRATWVGNGSANVSRDLLSRQTEASKHYKCQHIASEIHVVSSLQKMWHYRSVLLAIPVTPFQRRFL